MAKIRLWLTDILSRTLDDCDREAVRGDIQERGEGANEALRDVAGLVLRRELTLWKHWRPWLALVALVVPGALILGRVSRATADHSAIYMWLYANNWDWSFIRNAGYRDDLARFGTEMLMACFKLIGASCAVGLVLGFVSRRGAYVNAALFYLILLGTGRMGLHTARDFANNGAVFAVGFYRVIFPMIVQATLITLPVIWGVHYMRTTNHER